MRSDVLLNNRILSVVDIQRESNKVAILSLTEVYFREIFTHLLPVHIHTYVPILVDLS